MTQEYKEVMDYEEKRYNRWLKWLDKSQINANNKKTLRKFIDYGLAKGLSKARIGMYIEKIGGISLLLNKDFKKANREDVQRVMARLQSKNYSQNTIRTFQKIIKSFWRWLYDIDYNDPLPKCVKWIQCEKAVNNLQKEDLLTDEEIKKMISTADKLQWKCLISVLAEGGLRPGEAITASINSVHINQDHVRIKVAGKMRKKQGKREVLLFKSYDLINQWIDSHPLRDTPSSPLFIVKKSDHYKPFSVIYLNSLLKKIAKQSGITKKINTYRFRHSIGTKLVKKHGEAIARIQLGHAPGSKTISTYTHLSEEDVYETLSGKKPAEENDDKKCRCGHFNSYNSSRCSQCGLSFDVTAVVSQEELLKSTLKNMLNELGYNPVQQIQKV